MSRRLPRYLFAVAIATGLPATVACAADITLGRSLAATCTGCHGTDGRSVGSMPNIAGQDKNYLLAALKDFKAGKRPATVMHQHAKGYTDEQLELIAAYFAAQKTPAPAPAGRTGY